MASTKIVKKAAAKKRVAPSSVDQYIQAFPPDLSVMLQRIREIVMKILPASEEVISYQIPTVKYKGNYILAYAAFTSHCGLYTMSKAIITELKEDLEPFYTSGVTIRFEPGTSIPQSLIKKIIQLRLKEHEARAKLKPAKKK